MKVIEPLLYAPEQHWELFTAVMTSLFGLQSEVVNPAGKESGNALAGDFDLVTFPEAFAPADALVETLARISEFDWSGCIHVGLRPNGAAKSTHLFTSVELDILAARLAGLSESVNGDLAGFRSWLETQDGGNYNVGCVFTKDSDRNLRVCLHPKVVRSGLETSPFPEKHMTEADLLVLVTLVPADRQGLSVTIQPLLCSDLLDLETRIPGGTPMEAITRYADCFMNGPPDHVDLVSVATCTPQPSRKLTENRLHVEWHDKFREAFKRAADRADCPRHRHSAIVLSNYQTIEGGKQGGLSGVFMPVPPRHREFHSEVVVSAWGRPDSKWNNDWSGPEDDFGSWQTLGFIAALAPSVEPDQAFVRVFRFDIHPLLRQRLPWRSTGPLSICEVVVGHRQSPGFFSFRLSGGGDAR